MSDTAELQEHFGQPGSQLPGCGFPVAHLMVLFHAGTGLLREILASPLRTHDMSQVPQLHPALQAGDIAMGDRAFCSYAHMALLTLKGVFGVFRIHQKINVEFPTPEDPASEGATACKGRLPRWLHRLGAMDQLVEWMMKCDVRQRIGDFLRKYPGNTTVVTSRIVGYDQHIRYETLGFGHHRVARLAPDEIEEFIGKWYRVRIPLGPDRQRNILDLVGIIKNPDSHARQAIRPRGKTGQMLADPNSGNAGGNRAERAPDLPRCVGLGVPGLELARSAHQHQQDDRAVPLAMIGRERVQIGQGEAERAQTHAPDAQEVAPANTGTGSHHALTDRDHRGLSPLAPRNPPISPHQLGSNLPGQSGPRQVPVGFPGARGAAARRWLERNTGVIPVLSILRVSEVLSRLG